MTNGKKFPLQQMEGISFICLKVFDKRKQQSGSEMGQIPRSSRQGRIAALCAQLKGIHLLSFKCSAGVRKGCRNKSGFKIRKEWKEKEREFGINSTPNF